VEWLLLCAVSIAMLSLYLTKFTAFGIQYSQLVIVSTLAISSAAIRLRVSLLAKNNGASTYSAVIYTLAIIFSVIFFRLRSHYLVGCLVAYATFWLILRHLYGLATAESNNAYGVTCMLISLLVSVVREYSARVEYATAFMLDQETKKSRDLLSNMLPRRENAQALLNGEFVCEELKDVTLLYSDLKGFTDFASNKHPLQLAKLLDAIYSSFDRHLNHFGLYKIDIIGDAFVVVGGIAGRVHVKNPTLNCVMYAFHMLHDLQEINRQYGSNLKLRIGIHTGDAVGSVISLNKPRYLIWGA
ncbi:gca, partial [Symbiodinium microadriaticum]